MLTKLTTVTQGAPERIIKLCSTIITAEGTTVALTEKHVNEFEEAYRELGSMGERVIAFCDHELTQFPADFKFDLDDRNDLEMNGFRFLGLVALIDPPRYLWPIYLFELTCNLSQAFCAGRRGQVPNSGHQSDHGHW